MRSTMDTGKHNNGSHNNGNYNNGNYNNGNNGRPTRSLQNVLTLEGLLTILFRHPALLMMSLAGIVLGAGLSAVLLPTYEAQTQILVKHSRVDPPVTSVPGNPIVVSPVVPEEELNSEGVLLKSDDLLRNVVLKCDLNQQLS